MRTMETAGRAVVFSGTAVGIGLALMLVHAAAVHARLRHRRARDPARLGRVRADAAAGPALPRRRLALDRVRLIPRRVVERRDSDRERAGTGSRTRSCAGRRCSRPGRPRSCSRSPLPVLALELGPGSNEGIPQDLEGVQGLNIVADGGRRGRARADGDRRRHRPRGRRRRPGRGGRGRPARRGPRGGSGGGRRALRRGRAARRRDAAAT